jgi:adenine deaminase
VIGIIENQAPNRKIQVEVNVENGEVLADPGRDLAKAALVERHHGTGRVQVGLVSGFGLKGECAIASTMAHDSHNMIVVGTNDACMAAAANELAQVGGGQIVVIDGQVMGLLELPIGGIITDEKPELVAGKAHTILDGFRLCGCRLNNPNMQLSLMALPVIPELRLTDLGLVDVAQFKHIPVLEAKI